MNDELDPIYLIECAACLIRADGVSYLEAQSQIRDVFRQAWELADQYEMALVNMQPASDSLH